MKSFSLILTIILSTFNFNQKISKSDSIENHSEITTYFLIRHAEKDRSNPSEKDPKLTEAGIKRAQNWTKVLKDVSFDMVYSTNFNRTKATAQPIAEANNLEVEIYNQADMYNQNFQQKTKGKTVLIVGHSNTTPAFVNAILKNKKYEDLPDDENGGLYIVTVTPNNKVSTQLLYIN